MEYNFSKSSAFPKKYGRKQDILVFLCLLSPHVCMTLLVKNKDCYRHCYSNKTTMCLLQIFPKCRLLFSNLSENNSGNGDVHFQPFAFIGKLSLQSN